jgi:hypothetical protein
MALSYELGDLANQHEDGPTGGSPLVQEPTIMAKITREIIQSCGSTQSIKITNLPRNGFNIYVSI